jgi:hypothetical protein
MTPEMLALARKNAVRFFEATGLANVEFREGKIESLPVEDGTVEKRTPATEDSSEAGVKGLVAGAGFEPATFGL